MNILYISHLSGKVANGLSYSVPASVKAQAQIDNVLWLNTSLGEMSHWLEVKSFRKSKVIRNLNKLSPPFNNPDLVVFEGFYDDVNDVLLGRWLERNNIPYIIIPRSALTIQAMNNHAKFKKKIAHFLFYNHFIQKSLALQFLTDKEMLDTNSLFNHKSFVVPNGIFSKKKTKKSFSQNTIKGVFIGRVDIYQKGLDLLISAVKKEYDILKKFGFTLEIYGPESKDYAKVLNLIQENHLSDMIFLKGTIFGAAKEDVLLKSDVFFLTSRFEGHPMGLIEALSYGLPSLVTQGSNMGEEVEKFSCGWVCDDSIDSIASALLQMIEDKASYKERSNNAILLSGLYEWKRNAELFHNYVLELLKN